MTDENAPPVIRNVTNAKDTDTQQECADQENLIAKAKQKNEKRHHRVMKDFTKNEFLLKILGDMMKYELDLFRTVASDSLSLSTINKKRSLLPQVSWLCAFARNRRIEDLISTLTFTLSFVKLCE